MDEQAAGSGASPDLARARLLAQHVAGPPFATVSDAATAMLATQAQDFHGAKWALALRSTGIESDVDAALQSGAVVRTWPMRGTLLMLARADARWLTELLAPRSFRASAGVWRQAGLDERDFARARDIARDVLSGGRILGRAALQEAFDEGGVSTAAGRGAHLIRRIAGDTTIVFGPPRGTEQTFALLDDWVPGALRYDRDDALAELARRYVVGHAPATVRDLAWWSGLTLGDARRAVQLAGDAVDEDGDGWLRPADPAAASAASTAPAVPRRGDARLLPPFDELLLGYGDRSASLDPRHKDLVVPSSNGQFSPTITVDGVVAGVWRRTLVGSDGVEVELRPFESLSAGVEAAATRRAREYARYLGRAAVVTLAG